MAAGDDEAAGRTRVFMDPRVASVCSSFAFIASASSLEPTPPMAATFAGEPVLALPTAGEPAPGTGAGGGPPAPGGFFGGTGGAFLGGTGGDDILWNNGTRKKRLVIFFSFAIESISFPIVSHLPHSLMQAVCGRK